MDRKLDWEDYRVVLSVARTGSALRAAQVLGVTHSTVLRRLDGLERRLGARLFERSRSGMAATTAGETLRRAAERMEDIDFEATRRVLGRDLELTGVIRVTTTDTLAARVVPELIAGFRQDHPGIAFELTTGAAMANLTRREADIAIRATTRPPQTALGRRIGAIATAFYATPTIASDIEGPPPFEDVTWVLPDDSLADLPVTGWARGIIADDRVALRCDSVTNMVAAARAGIGVAALPCFLAEPDPALYRVAGPLSELASELWVLTHADLRRTARIRAFMDFTARTLTALSAELRGPIVTP